MGATVLARALVASGLAVVALGAGLSGPSPAAAALNAVNPVTIDDSNAGFLAFIRGDVLLDADENEGTLALGGDLTFLSDYTSSRATARPRTSPSTSAGA